MEYISIKDIQDEVCQAFKITRVAMLSPVRWEHIVKARHTAMWLCCLSSGLNYIDIARAFNRKNHATIVNAYKKVTYRREQSKHYRAVTDALLTKFNQRIDSCL